MAIVIMGKEGKETKIRTTSYFIHQSSQQPPPQAIVVDSCILTPVQVMIVCKKT
jgi:hypothetical protein